MLWLDCKQSIQKIVVTFKSSSQYKERLKISCPVIAIEDVSIPHDITKTRLYNFDPLKPRLLYSKTGVYRGIHYFSYF